ncbi:MAG TPA: STM3941 family protein, partial [Ktedonobacterales bacterium]|nr:STM3941 family protein [Ktedonobacterales bacterium]
MTTATLTKTQLRYYPSLLKMLAVLAGSLAFVLAGVWMLNDGTHRDPITIIVAYLAIGFFGLCALVGIAFMALIVFIRKPLLLINSRGIFAPFPIVRVGTDIHWEDVEEISVYKQRRLRP